MLGAGRIPYQTSLRPWEQRGLVLRMTMDDSSIPQQVNASSIVDRDTLQKWKTYSTTAFMSVGLPRNRLRQPGLALRLVGAGCANLTAQQGPQSANTFMAWLYLENSQTGSRVIEWKSENNPTQSYATFALDNLASNTFRFFVYTDAFTNIIGRSVSTPTIPNNVWIHIAATWDGGTTSAALRIYYNGVRVDDTDRNAGTFTTVYSGSDIKPLIGATWNDQSTEAQGAGLNSGRVDDCRVYNRALSQGEIFDIATAPLRGIVDGAEAIGLQSVLFYTMPIVGLSHVAQRNVVIGY